MTLERITLGEQRLHSAHVNVVNDADEIHFGCQTVDGSVEIHVDHGGIDVEVLNANGISLNNIVAVHAADEHASEGSSPKMNVADDLGLVESAGYLDDVIDVAGQFLIGRNEID